MTSDHPGINQAMEGIEAWPSKGLNPQPLSSTAERHNGRTFRLPYRGGDTSETRSAHKLDAETRKDPVLDRPATKSSAA